jgi:hypothetical protein
MSRKTRPVDDRENGALKAWELPDTPEEEGVSCPFLRKVTLLPLRYGRVESLVPGVSTPYKLKSRPLGIRMLRDGYIYILDESAGALHEYEYMSGALSGHNGGRLEYDRDSILYVCFSDVAWTARKKAQVLDDPEERAGLMQCIDLASGTACPGGKDLLTLKQASQWVAEFAEDEALIAEDGHNLQESRPYFWENQPYYYKTSLGTLIKQQNVSDPSGCLCLVLNDDIGVMLDLAQHQDDVVSWIDEWAKSGEHEGDTERDYVLGCFIESMTAVTDEVLAGTAAATGSEELKDLIADTTPAERQTIYRYLDVRKDYRGPIVLGSEEFYRKKYNDNPLIHAFLNMHDALGDARYRKHQATINTLNLQNYYRLNGAKLGEQGINDLVDRPRMAAFLNVQREKLTRWHTLLKDITEDRTTLLCDSRFHKAAWYFDNKDVEQIEAAFTLEYACLKDICRSDEAAEKVDAWMQGNPQYTRPLFHTLSLAEQVPDTEPAATYATIMQSGYVLVEKSVKWAQKLKQAESGKLPDLKNLSIDIQRKAAAVGDTLSPAVSMGLARALRPLYEASATGSLPPLDDIFRDLPYFFKGKMLDAINAGEAQFRIDSPDALNTFRGNLQRLMALTDKLSELSKEHDRAKTNHGHRSAKAQSLIDEFKATREEHRTLGRQVAAALSPVEEIHAGLKLEPATTGRAGLTLILSAERSRAMGNAMEVARSGKMPSMHVNMLGDGLSVLVAVVQAVNLYSVASETFSNGGVNKSNLPLIESLSATSTAGFVTAQGIADTLLTARANALANNWQLGALKGAHIRLGQLHVGLGLFGYLAGVFSYAMSTYKHGAEWLDAIKQGNGTAGAGAAMAMSGSAGLAVTSAYGFGRTLGSALQIVSVTGEARAQAWATAGTRLSGLFARLNLFGLAFTVLELAGTWIYNHYNLSERDKWLLSTPWTTNSDKNRKASLAEYEATLARLSEPVSITPAVETTEAGQKSVILNVQGWPPNALVQRLALSSDQPYRLSLSAWQVQLADMSKFIPLGEVWERCTFDVVESMKVLDGESCLQLQFTVPAPIKTRFGRKADQLMLMVRLETRQPDGQYRTDDYLLKLPPDGAFPVTPIDEMPNEEPVWRPVQQPLLALELYK